MLQTIGTINTLIINHKEKYMLAVIDLNNATHLIINIPLEGSDKSLPALARMLENNCVAVQEGWNSTEIVQPSTTIQLGNNWSSTRNTDIVMTIGAAPDVLTEDMIPYSPEIYVSMKDKVANLEKRLSEANEKLTYKEAALKEQALQVEDNKKVINKLLSLYQECLMVTGDTAELAYTQSSVYLHDLAQDLED
jgi:hypothetical protein